MEGALRSGGIDMSGVQSQMPLGDSHVANEHSSFEIDNLGQGIPAAKTPEQS
jgi:hypothetical protein